MRVSPSTPTLLFRFSVSGCLKIALLMMAIGPLAAEGPSALVTLWLFPTLGLVLAILVVIIAVLMMRIERFRRREEQSRNDELRAMDLARLSRWRLHADRQTLITGAGFGREPGTRRRTTEVIFLEQRLKIHEDDLGHFHDQLSRYQSRERPRISLELRLVDEEGTVFHCRISGEYAEPKDGSHTGWSGIVQDLSLRRRAERDLEAIFRMSEDAFAIIDNEGFILLANPAAEAFFGGGASLTGRVLDTLFADEFREEVLEAASRSRRGEPAGIAEMAQDLGAHRKYYSLEFAHDDHTDRMIMTAVDITASRLAKIDEDERRDALARSDKLASLGVLVSSMAHEINNPNNFIMLNTPVLRQILGEIMGHIRKDEAVSSQISVGSKDWAWIEASVPRLLDGIDNGSARIKGIVEDLRRYVRGDSEKPGPVDLHKVLKDTLMLVSHLVNRSSSNFSLEMPSHLPQIRGVGAHIEQILVNLIINATQALENRDQSISVGAVHRDRQAGFVVRDSGIGMTEEVRVNATRAFITTKGDSGGTGLGLAVVARLVDAHDGNLEIESEVGRGTTITVTFPVVED